MTSTSSPLPQTVEPSEGKRWPASELQYLAAMDARLRKRVGMMLEDKAAQPLAMFPQGSRSPAAAKASYRLTSNKDVSAQDILLSHREATWERMKAHPVVLAVADTTSFAHSSHPGTEGLGPIGGRKETSTRGFFLHSVLALSEQGDVLGVLHAQTWARDSRGPTRQQKQAVKNRLALEQRESYRWTQAYEAIVEQQKHRQPDAHQPRVVMVGDRESDIYELFVSNQSHDSHCGVLVRALHDRRMQAEGQIVWAHLEQQPPLGSMILEVPAQGKRPARQARLVLRSAPVTLGVPKDKARFFGASQELRLWALEAVENEAPAGSQALHWKLLSSTPAPGLAEAQRQLGWYAQRWGIEVFHRTLKSGCQSEARALRSLEKLERALSLDMIVACRLLALRDAARRQPQTDARQWLETEECEVLVAWHSKRAPADQPPPTVAQVVSWISRLGGHLARKSDPPPGVQVLWRGLQRLHGMVEAWKLAKTCG